MVQASGRQWTVTDCASTNRTFEEGEKLNEKEDGPKGWREMPSDSPIPVVDGMTLCLGSELLLRFTLERPSSEGTTTARKSPGPRAARQRITPLNLELAARALLARRRADPHDRGVPTITEWAAELGKSEPTVYRRKSALMTMKEVEPLLRGQDELALAEALEAAFPYLRAPSPGASSAG